MFGFSHETPTSTPHAFSAHKPWWVPSKPQISPHIGRQAEAGSPPLSALSPLALIKPKTLAQIRAHITCALRRARARHWPGRFLAIPPSHSLLFVFTHTHTRTYTYTQTHQGKAKKGLTKIAHRHNGKLVHPNSRRAAKIHKMAVRDDRMLL